MVSYSFMTVPRPGPIEPSEAARMYIPISVHGKTRRTSILAEIVECARRTPLSRYMAVLGPGVLLLALAGLQPFVPVAWLTRDPLAVASDTGLVAFYFGALSSLGVMALCVGIGAGLLGAVAAARVHADRRQALLLAAGAAIGSLMAVDDMFMLHEHPGLRAFHGELVLFALYGLSLLAWTVLFRREILGSASGGLVLVALGGFAGSVLADLAVSGAGDDSIHWLVEDGAKFLGYLAWSGFHFLAALDTAARPTGPA